MWVFLLCLGVLLPASFTPGQTEGQNANGPARPPGQSPSVIQSESAPDLLAGGRTGANYVIGAEDVLEIEVFNVPELTKVVRVSNDGTITLPLLGPMQAAGLTTHQLRRQLEEKYGETYLENPQVTVSVREFHAQPVSVIGAVERPGLYQVTGPRTLIEVLSMAGGLAKRSSAPAGRSLLVTRKGGFGELPAVEGMTLVAPNKVEIDLRRLLYSRDDALNIDVKSLDIISVSKADVVYVLGGVKKAGGFVLEDQEKITVVQALAMAEGLSGTASRKGARIVRRSGDGGRTEIPLDLGKVLKGKTPDPELAANDILYVPDSASKVAGRRGLDAAIATLSGIIIWRRP